MASAARPSRWAIASILGIGILSASTAAIFIRLALDAAGTSGAGFSLVLTASRLSIAALLLVPTWHRFKLEEIRQNAAGYSIAAGIFLALHFATWITSLSYTSIAASTTLVTTNPIWVALLSWVWFRERPSWMTASGMAIALIGGTLIGVGDRSAASLAQNPLLGNALALIGAWAVSLYFLLGREAQRHGLDIRRHIAITYSTAALVALPLPLLFGASYRGYPPQVYFYIFMLALFPQLIGHTSFNWSVRWVSPTLVALVILAEPIGSGLLGILLFQEYPGGMVLGGAGVILGGVAIAVLGTRTHSIAANHGPHE